MTVSRLLTPEPTKSQVLPSSTPVVAAPLRAQGRETATTPASSAAFSEVLDQANRHAPSSENPSSAKSLVAKQPLATDGQGAGKQSETSRTASQSTQPGSQAGEEVAVGAEKAGSVTRSAATELSGTALSGEAGVSAGSSKGSVLAEKGGDDSAEIADKSLSEQTAGSVQPDDEGDAIMSVGHSPTVNDVALSASHVAESDNVDEASEDQVDGAAISSLMGFAQAAPITKAADSADKAVTDAVISDKAFSGESGAKKWMSEGDALLARLSAAHAQLSDGEAEQADEASLAQTALSTIKEANGKELPPWADGGKDGVKPDGQKSAGILTGTDSPLSALMASRLSGGDGKSTLLTGATTQDGESEAVGLESLKGTHALSSQISQGGLDELTGDHKADDAAGRTHQGQSAPLLAANKAENTASAPAIQLHKDQAGDKLADQVQMMMAKNLKQIDIRLDPPELGKLHIKLSLNQDQASVHFTVANSQTRDLVEQAMPRLRELLGQQGIQLAQGSVQQDSAGQNGGQFHQQEQSSGNGMMTTGGTDPGQGSDGDVTELWMSQKKDGVDYYA